MNCKWGHDDCLNENSCLFCSTVDFKYKPKKRIKSFTGSKNHPDKRMGSRFEFENHKKNESVVSSNMTLNSGATVKEKGDEQISGIISIMEELKTKVSKQARGKETFTIQKKWLLKLRREAMAERREFYYLKFRFLESDDDTYCVIDSDEIMSMVKTMITDRTKAKECDDRIDFYKKRFAAEEARKIAALAEVEELKAKIKILNKK